MNVAQLIRLALRESHAIQQDSTTTPDLVESELLAWANVANAKLEMALRRNKQDFFLRARTSTNAAYRWEGERYDPASFQLASGTREYTLPPDVIELRSIRVTTTGQEYRLFKHQDLAHPQFQRLLHRPATERLLTDYTYWDVVGKRTLLLANPPEQTLDVELRFVGRTRRLRVYTTGTVIRSNASATVPGTSTAWVDDGADPGSELIVSSGAGAPQIVGQSLATGGIWVDENTVYQPLAEEDVVDSNPPFVSNTSLTLAGPHLGTTDAGARGHMLASVPQSPPEHHGAIVEYLKYRIRYKMRDYNGAAAAKAEWDRLLVETAQDTSLRQTADPWFVEEFSTEE